MLKIRAKNIAAVFTLRLDREDSAFIKGALTALAFIVVGSAVYGQMPRLIAFLAAR